MAALDELFVPPQGEEHIHPLETFVEKYTKYSQRGYDPAHCKRWAIFHYNRYLIDGVLPDFMRV